MQVTKIGNAYAAGLKPMQTMKPKKKKKKKKKRKRHEHLGTWLIGILPYPSTPLPRNAVRFSDLLARRIGFFLHLEN
jgi:hypothetical protein